MSTSSGNGHAGGIHSTPRSTSFSSFVTVAASLSQTFASLSGPCRAWKAFTAGDSSRDEPLLCTDPMELLRQLDLKHPAALLIHDVVKGHHRAYGSGVTSLVTLIGLLAVAVQRLTHEGVPTRFIICELRRLRCQCERIADERTTVPATSAAPQPGTCAPRIGEHDGEVPTHSDVDDVDWFFDIGYSNSPSQPAMAVEAETDVPVDRAEGIRRLAGLAHGDTVAFPAVVEVCERVGLLPPLADVRKDDGEEDEEEQSRRWDLSPVTLLCQAGASFRGAAVMEGFAATLSNREAASARLHAHITSADERWTEVRVAVLSAEWSTAEVPDFIAGQAPLPALRSQAAAKEEHMRRVVELLRCCDVSIVLCSGSVEGPLLSLCASIGVLVLACVPQRLLDAIHRLAHALDVADIEYLLPSHIGRARCRLLEQGWSLHQSAQRTAHRPTDAGATCQLLFSPCHSSPSHPRAMPPTSVLSSHSSIAGCHGFTFHFWHALHRVRNAARDGWRMWQGGGATEVEWIRHLSSGESADEGEEGEVEDAALYRPLVTAALIEVLRSVVVQCIVNTGCARSRAEAIFTSCVAVGGAPITEAAETENGDKFEWTLPQSGAGAVWDVRCEKLAVWDAAITACDWLCSCDTLLQARDGRTHVIRATAAGTVTLVI